MTDSPFYKLLALCGALVVIGAAFSGGIVAYGYLSDSEEGGISATAENASGSWDDEAGNTTTCAGNTECDGETAAIVRPVELSPAKEASQVAF